MTAAVSICNVSKSFGDLTAVFPLNLQIEQGEFFGLLGPNGAGKTTLINMLAGLTRPDTGTLCIMGHNVLTNYRAARRIVGVVPQELIYDPFFTVKEGLEFQAGYYGIRNAAPWIEELIDNLGLSPKADTNLRALSGGMKRRFLVAQALVHRPPVIILDEPTAGVDVELRQSLWHFIQQLNERGHTIMLTTHYLEEAERLCSRVALLKGGRLAALDQIETLLARYGKLRLKVGIGGAVLPQSLAHWYPQQDEGYWLFDLRTYDQAEEILGVLKQQGIAVTDLHMLRPDLESVFLQLIHTE